MKLHIPSMLIALTICITGFAQDKPESANTDQSQISITQTTTNNKTPQLFNKSTIGIFTYANTNFTPGNIIGASVGAKYFLLNKFAVRGGVSFSSSNTGDNRRRYNEFGHGTNDFNSSMPG